MSKPQATVDHHIYLTPELARHVEAIAQAEDRSITSLLRVLVKEALEARALEADRIRRVEGVKARLRRQ
jgi:hypothetical protein